MAVSTCCQDTDSKSSPESIDVKVYPGAGSDQEFGVATECSVIHDFDFLSEDEDDGRQFPELETKIKLSWENVSVKLASGKSTKFILDNVSGQVLPGQFVSILGSSGAGKTTLLNFLSGQFHASNFVTTGVVKINDAEAT